MALNEKTKNKYRRVIRGMMIVLAVVLLTMGLAVPITNNAIAMGDARALKELSAKEAVDVLETTSRSGRLVNKAGHVQYFAAMLIRSDRSLEDLRTQYAAHDEDSRIVYRVAEQKGQEITVLEGVSLAFRETVGEDGYYIVYSLRNGGNTAQWWLDMDVRG